MTREEQSDMWKAEIEKGLKKVQTLREELRPVEFASGLWEQLKGAYGDVREDVAFLFCPREMIPETKKIRRLDFEDKDSYEIIFDNLSENLTHQLSLYGGTYLAMPYLALLLELKRLEGDFDWQMKIIALAGDLMATDIPYCGGGSENQETLPREVLDSYRLSVAKIQEMTKAFLDRNMDRLRQVEPQWMRQYFCTDALAILGDPEAAYQMLMGQWEQCPLSCPDCGYYDEDMEADGFSNEEQLAKIEPAPSVIGQWDKESYEDTYVWFSNLVHLLEVEDAWKAAYYFGTYTCPVCGSKGTLIEWMKENQE